MKKPSTYLTSGQMAQALNVSPKTVWSWINQGLIKSVRLPGGTYRVPVSELERIERGEPMPAEDTTTEEPSRAVAGAA